MTPTIIALLCAFVFGLAAAIVLLPMAMRIPARLERRWAHEYEAYAQAAREGSELKIQPYTLAQKAFVVAAAMGLCFVVVTIYGSGPSGIAYSFYYFSLLLLVAINVKHALLPDSIVLTTLWAGLLYHASTGGAAEHVYGAALGYGVPFLIDLMVRTFTRKEIMGQCDLKALAMAGAWFGMAAIPTLLVAFVVGLIAWGIAAPLLGKKPAGLLPTGPGHLLASLAVTLGTTVF